MPGLLDQIAADAAKITSNLSEFAGVHKIDGVDVKCIVHRRAMDPDPALDQFQLQPTRRRQLTLIAAQESVGCPVAGSELFVDDEAWLVMSSKVIGRHQVRIILYQWEG